MRILIIAVFLAITVFGFIMEYLTYSRRNAPLPENVKDVYDKDEYKRNQSYKMDQLRFSIITEVISVILWLLILLLNFHHILYEFIVGHTTNLYLTSLFIVSIPVLILTIIGTILGLYDTFVIEERYGFNKTTPGTYVLDFIKNLAITFVIVSILLSLFLLLHNLLGNWVFLAFFFVLLVFQLFMTFISPQLIRIFYKLTPLEEGELKDRIEALAGETGYKLKGIYMVDASKRSTKLNAFAAGFGKTKTIGLFDTLIEKMTDDEIIFILGHEIGHAKKGHILKSAPLGLLSFGVLLTVAFFIITMPETAQAFGFADVNLAFGIFVVFILVSPLMMVLQIPANILSRKHEYEADAFGAKVSSKEFGISSLKKLYKEDLGNLTPHPFVVMIEHSHPPLTQRVSALESLQD
jgi:STE24 endopeptidase